jgi:hypothetical protein
MTPHRPVSVIRVIALLLLLSGAVPASSQTLLVDFGSSAGENSFGLAGWSTLLMGGTLTYTADGPGGLVSDITAVEYADYMGVRGTPRQFSAGERIVVTWYNRSEETVRFTARVSFTDADQADGGSAEGTWFTMRSAADYRQTWTELAPGETGRTMFAIRDHGVHKTDGSFDLVNVNCAVEWGASDQQRFLVCDRIELFDDADVTPPSAPTGLTVQQVTDSKVALRWNPASDDVGVVEYLVYADGEIEGYAREEEYTAVYCMPGDSYAFTVTARDMMGNESSPSTEVRPVIPPFAGRAALLKPSHFHYGGAFRLPEEFQWGGEAVAYYPDGDGGQSGAGANDGRPGSLFVTNLNQPENGLVGELSIPAPALSAQGVEQLPAATLLQQPVDIRPDDVNGWDYVDIWRTGLEYLPAEQMLYSSWSIHYTVGGGKHASISRCPAADLSSGPFDGAWYVGAAAQPPIDAQMSDWLFAVPENWADAHTQGRQLVTGRCRDGGLSGLGPTLYAIPAAGGAPPATGSELPYTTLLEYGPVENSDNYHFPDAVDGYRHSDDWREAAWVRGSWQNAVAVIGRKAHGDNWYGYHGEGIRHDWVIADVPYPEFGATDPDGKGWRAHRLRPMIILYDPDDLAAVAAGSMQSHEPQPYAAVRIDEDIFFGPEREIFSAAFDAHNQSLYITEFLREADGGLVMHVFDIVGDPVRVPQTNTATDLALDAWPDPVRDVLHCTVSGTPGRHVRVMLSDVLGRTKLLHEGDIPAGGLQLSASMHNRPSGPVFLLLITPDGISSRKVMKR